MDELETEDLLLPEDGGMESGGAPFSHGYPRDLMQSQSRSQAQSLERQRSTGGRDELDAKGLADTLFHTGQPWQ